MALPAVLSGHPRHGHDFFQPPENRLGNADSYGYARIVRELGELKLPGAARAQPVQLVFSSDPRLAPGPFGPGWRIPLLSSAVVPFGQYKLYWDGPDEKRHYFVLDPTARARRDERIYRHRGLQWTARVHGRGDDVQVLIESTLFPGWSYRYRKGRLAAFRMGEKSSECRLTWSGSGQLLKITESTRRSALLEIDYETNGDPRSLRIGEDVHQLAMGEGRLKAPDGRPYSRAAYLRRLASPGAVPEIFTYEPAEPRRRNGQRLAVNRLSVRPDPPESESGTDSATKTDAPDGNGGFLEWEARSGFITADSGAEYEVENLAWDPLRRDESGKSGGTAPDAVQLVRRPRDGTPEQLWAYDWNSGVNTYTDLATGETLRKTWILSEGPAHLKLRKQEKKQPGGWELLEKRSYDPKGRLIRMVSPGEIRKIVWKDKPSGSISETYVNGNLHRFTKYVGDKMLERKIFRGNGEVERYVFSERDGLRTINRYLNNELSWYQELDEGRLVYMKWPSGYEQYLRHFDGGSHQVDLHPDGRREVLERVDGIKGYKPVETPEQVAAVIEFFMNHPKKK